MNEIDRNNVFIIPCTEDKYIIYIPLHSCSFYINAEGASAISRYIKGVPFQSSEREIYRTLEDIFSSPQIVLPLENTNPFESNNIAIILHQKCNLECTYCFAHDDRGKESMDLCTVKTIIDSCIHRRGKKTITFIGGGEPTLDWPLLRDSILYIRKYGKENIIKVVTNGTLLDDAKLRFLESQEVILTISFDILPDIQDSQRKYHRGTNSTYLAVENLIKKLEDYHISFAIRATITENAVYRMPEMVKHILDNFPHVKRVHLEHITADNLSESYYAKFVKYFFEARAFGKCHGLEVYNSITVAQNNIKSFGFCSGDKCFIPQPTGEIFYAFCHRFSTPNKKEINNIKISTFDTSGVHIPNPQYSQLSIPKKCESCFARWHCAGGCAAEQISLPSNLLELKCDMVREFCKLLLQEGMGE